MTAELLARGIRPFELPISYRARSHLEGKKISWLDGVHSLRILVTAVTARFRHSQYGTRAPRRQAGDGPSTALGDGEDGLAGRRVPPCLDAV